MTMIAVMVAGVSEATWDAIAEGETMKVDGRIVRPKVLSTIANLRAIVQEKVCEVTGTDEDGYRVADAVIERLIEGTDLKV